MKSIQIGGENTVSGDITGITNITNPVITEFIITLIENEKNNLT